MPQFALKTKAVRELNPEVVDGDAHTLQLLELEVLDSRPRTTKKKKKILTWGSPPSELQIWDQVENSGT